MKEKVKVIGCTMILVCVVMLCGGCSSTLSGAGSVATAEAGYSWEQTDSSLALLKDEQVVWKLNYGRCVWNSEGDCGDEKLNCKKAENKCAQPYFHPLSLTDGMELTQFRTKVHPWHKGLWFSWKHINGLNYWNWHRGTGYQEGLTEVQKVDVKRGGDGSANIKMLINYFPQGKAAVMTERRVLKVSAPDEKGCYRIDWQSTFTAGKEDLLLDRTPITGEPGGVNHGGYAGLSVRLANSMSEVKVTDSDRLWGKQTGREKGRWGLKVSWVDVSGKTAGGRAGGVTIFDHPNSFRHPTPWWMAVGGDTFYCQPALLYYKPYKLAAGKSLKLWYRILVHPEEADRAMPDEEWKAFSVLKD